MRRCTTSFCLSLALLIMATPAVAQPACDDSTLEGAFSSYDVGRFARTFALLDPCLPNGFAHRDQRVSAYRLMALSYIARDSLEEARRSVGLLLKANSRYHPDLESDPQLFADLVSDLKPRWYTFLWRGNAWYHWTARAVVVGGVASLPFLLRSNEPPDLPRPPGNPDR